MTRPSTGLPWRESLGGVRHGDLRPYRIRKILFGMVQNRCHELGMREGDTIRCLRKDAQGLEVRLSSGKVRQLPNEYAWFIEVEAGGALKPEARAS